MPRTPTLERERIWHAKHAAVLAKIEPLYHQLEQLEDDWCPECGELRDQHDADCNFAEWFGE